MALSVWVLLTCPNAPKQGSLATLPNKLCASKWSTPGVAVKGQGVFRCLIACVLLKEPRMLYDCDPDRDSLLDQTKWLRQSPLAFSSDFSRVSVEGTSPIGTVKNQKSREGSRVKPKERSCSENGNTFLNQRWERAEPKLDSHLWCRGKKQSPASYSSASSQMALPNPKVSVCTKSKVWANSIHAFSWWKYSGMAGTQAGACHRYNSLRYRMHYLNWRNILRL